MNENDEAIRKALPPEPLNEFELDLLDTTQEGMGQKHCQAQEAPALSDSMLDQLYRCAWRHGKLGAFHVEARELLAAQRIDPILPAPPATFEVAWKPFEDAGFRYGHDAIEQVRFGFEIANGRLPEAPAGDKR